MILCEEKAIEADELGTSATSLVELNESARDANEERCERLTQAEEAP